MAVKDAAAAQSLEITSRDNTPIRECWFSDAGLDNQLNAETGRLTNYLCPFMIRKGVFP